MSLTALEWGLRAPITPRFGGNLEALPRPQDTEPKQQQKTDLKHKESDRPQIGFGFFENGLNPNAVELTTEDTESTENELFALQ